MPIQFLRKAGLWAGSVAKGLALFASLSSAAVAQKTPESAPIVIAAPLSLSGDGHSFGSPTLEGVRYAVHEAQAAEPALSIQLEVLDDRTSDDEAKVLSERIVAGPAVVVIGPTFSTSSMAAGPVYSRAGLASLPPTATSDAITANATTFRVLFKNSDQGQMLANYVVHVMGRHSAEVVVVQSGYGDTLRQGFERAAAWLKLDAHFHLLPRDADEATLNALAETLAPFRDRPVVFLTLDPEGASLLKRLRRLGHPGPFLGGDAFGNEAFPQRLQNEPEEKKQPGFFTDALYGLAPVILDSANAATLSFSRRFRAYTGHDPNWQAVAGYDAGRIAIAAIRVARAAAPNDPREQRKRVHEYLLALDSPPRAEPGLLGPFWFDNSRARQQAIRVGRFRGGHLESAPVQIVSVSTPAQEEVESGEVFELESGRFARLQRVVYTGVFINEIQGIDITRSSFSSDFYVWLRFARDAGTAAADPTDLLFPTQIGGQFDRSRTSERRTRPDGTEYWLWRLQGEFRNDFDLRRYPFDKQVLSLSFFNARAANDRIVYALDRLGAGNGGSLLAQDKARAIVSDEAFRNVTQWDFRGIEARRENLVTRSVLGDVDRTAAEGTRELSGFVVAVDMQRRTLTTLAKSLLPLLVMSMITFASLFFPNALVKEKVTVAITGALSGAVLLAAINNQLGSVGYTVAVEYVFYIFFGLALLCILSVLAAETLRTKGNRRAATSVELGTRVIYGVTTLVVAGAIAHAAI